MKHLKAKGVDPDNHVAMGDILPFALYVAPSTINDDSWVARGGHEVLSEHSSSSDDSVTLGPFPLFLGDSLAHTWRERQDTFRNNQSNFIYNFRAVIEVT